MSIFVKIKRSINYSARGVARFLVIESIINKILSCKKLEMSGRYLDLGCGKGYASLVLRKHFSEIINLDINKEGIRACKHNCRSICAAADFLVADASVLPFKKSCFNVISVFSLIEHLQNQSTLLKEVKRVLLEKGIFVMQFPNGNFFIDLHTGIPFPGIIPRKLMNLYYRYILKASGQLNIWNLTKRKAIEICQTLFDRVYVENCNYSEENVPAKIRSIYRLLKRTRILELCPLGWIVTCIKGAR